MQDPLAVFGDLVADSTGMVHSGVFNSIARIFTPRYRQMSIWGFMVDKHDLRKREAMDFAAKDLDRAFQHFLKIQNGKPFILAGHSQGSMLLCQLIKRNIRKDFLFDQLIVSYLVAADLSDGDCGDVVRECSHPSQLGCFVHYNVLIENGDRNRFIIAEPTKNLSCVNPISFNSDNSSIPARDNPGSRPFLRPLEVLKSIYNRFVLKNATLLNFMSKLEPGLFGARCDQGIVWINPSDATGFWTTGLFPGKNLHGGETSLFYLSTRLNANHRVETYLLKNSL